MKTNVSIIGDHSCVSSRKNTQEVIELFKGRGDVNLMFDRTESFYSEDSIEYDKIAEHELEALEKSDIVIIDSREEEGRAFANWIAGYCWAIGVSTILLHNNLPFNVTFVSHDERVTTVDELMQVDLQQYKKL